MAILYLTRAYLQVHVCKSLWPYKTVMLQGQRNVAPMIMRSIMSSVMSQDESYHHTLTMSSTNIQHPLIRWSNTWQNLDWHAWLPSGFKMGHECLVCTFRTMVAVYAGHKEETLYTPRLLWRDGPSFSVCGKLGHFPVCGWLCMAKAYMKHCTNKVITSLDDETNDMLEILVRVQWVDTSSLVVGVMLVAPSE